MNDHWTDFHTFALEAGHIGVKPFAATISPAFL
jgi:hypothetical protein